MLRIGAKVTLHIKSIAYISRGVGKIEFYRNQIIRMDTHSHKILVLFLSIFYF